MQKTIRIALLAVAALALPATAAAQQQTQPAPAPAQAASAQDEAARIQQRITQLQQQAQQDSAVKVVEAEFDAYMRAAMGRLDAAFAEKSARAEALKAEVEAARAASDNAKLNALAAEATELQGYFNGLRQRALAQADVQEKRKVYVQALFSKMNEIDPQAQALVARLQELRSGGARARQR
ncbi:MAG TPA: hypothetical protein VHG28_00365 [Longimicrobiaceae bacterium]|nr:hypothetical protein [Longimicrobiaceae bacterium]